MEVKMSRLGNIVRNTTSKIDSRQLIAFKPFQHPDRRMTLSARHSKQ